MVVVLALNVGNVQVRVPALLVLPGCCSTFCKGWCDARCADRSVSHVMTFAIMECAPKECVFYLPGQLRHVHRGQVVHFANTTPYTITVTVQPPSGTVFDGVPNNQFDVQGNQIKSLTVSSAAPVLPGNLFPLKLEVTAPGALCPGYPGPGMEVDN